ncbi:DUF695 domain-containing protein [Pseudomonas koreensis]|uniref:DUF695 domain-containing protein n=1 Tax=Pseudomonas koreensis TaxID=198620 RepID=A0AA94JJP6_9PSED|nr:DUF695 domain-containing protein [Pseudomonas koreensis]RVD79547.1 hypothetical protein A9HBioS_0071 [Pseudomonas koreensis]
MKHTQTNDAKKPMAAGPFALLLTLAAVITAGCSHKPPPVERDPCLDAGPVKSTAYDSCVADREERKAQALRVLLSDDPADHRQLQLAEPDENSFQLADFPDAPIPATFRIADSISARERQALPFKVRVTWKHAPTTAMLKSRDRARMAEMESLIRSAATDNGLAKWVCTVTGVHQREWIFYARNDAAFITQIHTVLAPTGPYPVELTSRKEPALSAEESGGDRVNQAIRITPKQCVE